MAVEVRQQRPEEWDDVLGLVDEAFDRPSVVRLVELMHASGNWIAELSLVAVVDGALVGHVCLSRLPLHTGTSTVPVLTLTPLSVRPRAQRRGIARALVTRALAVAADRPEPLVVLEGDPALYGRFGFTRAADHGIERPSELIPEQGFQLATLPNYRRDLRGRVEYPDYFAATGSIGPAGPLERGAQ